MSPPFFACLPRHGCLPQVAHIHSREDSHSLFCRRQAVSPIDGSENPLHHSTRHTYQQKTFPTKRVLISSGYEELTRSRVSCMILQTPPQCVTMVVYLLFTPAQCCGTNLIIIDSFCNTLICDSIRFSCKHTVSSVFTVIKEVT